MNIYSAGRWLLATCFLIQHASAQQARPDRIVLNVTADPARSAAVTWRTNAATDSSYAEIAPATPNPAFTGKAQRLPAATTAKLYDSLDVRYHSVVFENLQPETEYAYRVGKGDDWSEWFEFRTAGLPGQPFSFIYLGDAQTNLLSLWSRAIRKAWAAAPDARLIIHAGDLVNRGNNYNEWQQWFEAGSFIHASIPGLMTPGNHEYHYPNDSGQVSVFWRPQFTLPENGPAGLEETCYYTDVQGVRFISLNSQEIEINERLLHLQREWLEKVLKENKSRWTIVTFHHPVLSTKKNRDNKFVREHIKPLLDKYGVDLVLTGHDHTYARGRDGNQGPVYAVSVSGPKMYEVDPAPWMAKTGSHQQFYQVIRIDGNTLHYNSYTVDGQLHDAFQLRKQTGRQNALTNLKKP
ncbi:metallophosphoesterase family protein [Chitinophaga pollutisoli]|uniref:Metallophosphoesterase family protein n=1 Tax=Chitinophaga pollutisoli TaxID=3133966 RepID=A0ABZ2YN08_9BACT